MNMHVMKKNYKFTTDQINAVKLGRDLTKRYLYDDAPKIYAKYASFSKNDLTLEQHDFAFLEELKASAYNKSGVNPDSVSPVEAIRYEGFRVAVFSVMEEIIDGLTSKNEAMDMMNFMEIRDLANGDSANIDIKSSQAYVLSKNARGIKDTYIQRRYGDNVVLSPEKYSTTISYNFKDIIANRVSIGRELARMVRGVKTSWLKAGSDLVFSTTSNPVANKLISTAAFSEATFRLFAQKVSAWNGGQAYVYGTNIALSYLLPDSTLRYELGSEYMDKGYISTAFGTKVIELQQALNPKSYMVTAGTDTSISTILPNDYVIIASSNAQRPMILGLGGGVRITEIDASDSATEDMIVTINQDYDVKLASQGIVAIFKTTS